MKLYLTEEEFENATSTNYLVIKGVNIIVEPFHFDPVDLNSAKLDFDRKAEEYKKYLDSVNDTCWVDFDNGELSLNEISDELDKVFKRYRIDCLEGIFSNFYSEFRLDECLKPALLIAYDFKDCDEEITSKCTAYLDALSKSICGYDSKEELIEEMKEHYIGYYSCYEDLFDDLLDEYDVLGPHADIVRNYLSWSDDEFYKEIYEAEECCQLYCEGDYYFHD